MRSIIREVLQYAGLAGLALIVFYYLFREIIRKQIFPRLDPDRAYRILRLSLVLIFLIAVVGVAAWLYHDIKLRGMLPPRNDLAKIGPDEAFSHTSKGEPLGRFAEWVEQNSVYHAKIDARARKFKLCRNFQGTVETVFNEIQKLYPTCLRVEITTGKEKIISIAATQEFVTEKVASSDDYECSRCKK